MTLGDKVLDWWRARYAIIIPTICIVLLVLLCWILKLDASRILESKNINGLLEALITFVTIIVGVFGFLLPILISNQKEDNIITLFLRHANVKLFRRKLKNTIISGFVVVFLCCLLFLHDVLQLKATIVLALLTLWILLFFICSAYRFIGIILSLVISGKNFESETSKVAREEEMKSLKEKIESTTKKETK
ncbi:MAG: hypothetical protein Q4C48_08905 [Lachnospiraceae bacterium]|nr:hypothetical protein [Lachnospiraceae bacterium]